MCRLKTDRSAKTFIYLPRLLAIPLGLGLLLLCLSGCSSHLVYVHNATMGVDVNLSAESGTVKLSMGYDRETFAVVPKHESTANLADRTKNVEAMSLVSVSNVDATGIDELIFNHMVATGYAAKKVAQDPEGLRTMRRAVFGETPN